jgi:hypothetical protein
VEKKKERFELPKTSGGILTEGVAWASPKCNFETPPQRLRFAVKAVWSDAKRLDITFYLDGQAHWMEKSIQCGNL